MNFIEDVPEELTFDPVLFVNTGVVAAGRERSTCILCGASVEHQQIHTVLKWLDLGREGVVKEYDCDARALHAVWHTRLQTEILLSSL